VGPVTYSTARFGNQAYLGCMEPLRREEAFAGLDPQIPTDSAEVADSRDSLHTFAGLVLATALGLYSWAALLLFLRWIL
jgi:hypothetical protein